MPASHPSKARLAAIEAAGLKEQFCRDYLALPDRDALAAKYAQFLGGLNARSRLNVLSQLANFWGAVRGAEHKAAPHARPLPPGADATEIELQAQVKADRERERLKAQAKHHERLYLAALREQALEDRLVDAVRETVTAMEPAPYRPLVSRRLHGDEHAAVAMLSDLHIGEKVSPEQTGGLGRFDLQIAARRLGYWAETLVELVELRRTKLSIPSLHLLLGGDMVSGSIHEELARTNNPANMVDQMAIGAHFIAQAIRQVAPHFEWVHVTGVMGNHGRMTQKPPAKNRHESWDHLLYQLAAFMLQEQTNVTWTISKSFFEMVDVLGFRVLLMHGDSIRGSLGIPYYGIERANARMRQVEAMGKLPQHDIMCIGHFHDLMENSRFIINGSLKGGDEYSAGMLHVADQPMQVLFYIKQPYGITATEKLYLSAGDERADCELATGLPGVWAAV